MKLLSLIPLSLGVVLLASSSWTDLSVDVGDICSKQTSLQNMMPSSTYSSDDFVKAVTMYYKSPGVGSIIGWNSTRGEIYSNGYNYYVKSTMEEDVRKQCATTLILKTAVLPHIVRVVDIW